MSDLIEALTILARYMDEDESYPTCCGHDELCVLVDPAKVSAVDMTRLEQLSFTPQPREGHFRSFRFGSA